MLKSTEIVIEQLIIGLLFMVIVVLFVWGNPLPLLHSGDDAFQTFFFGVLVIIAAYAAGIVIDRWSDTLLEQFERRIRIQVYTKNKTYRQMNLNMASLPEESYLRLAILKDGGGIADHHDYLRSRMRITRALTCLMPALFLALALLGYTCESQKVLRWIAGGITFSLYALVLTYGIFLEPVLKGILRRRKQPDLLRKYLVPNTHNTKELFSYSKFHEPKEKMSGNYIRIIFRYWDLVNPALLGLMLFAVFEIVFLIVLHSFFSPTNTFKISLYMIGGLTVTGLVGWTWWRISKTFFTMLRHYDEFGK